MANVKERMANVSPKQRIIAAAVIVLFIVIIWQVIGLFSSETPNPEPNTPKSNTAVTTTNTQTPPPPKQVALPPRPPMSPRELELIRLQQETQAKYLAAASELQILKIERDIAQTNQAIAAAKLATVTAQKSVVELLTPPAPAPVSSATYATNLSNPQSGNTAAPGEEGAASYVVLSVSYTMRKWNALVGYQGKIYSVSVGDILPPDGSVVLGIDKTGVLIKKDDARRKITVVSAI